MTDEIDPREWSEAVSALHAPLYGKARAIHLDYPQLSVFDYADAGWRWVNHHPKRVMTAHEDETNSRLLRAIERYMQMVGRREKASQSGYRVEDEAFYPKTLIEICLPALWDLEYASAAPVAADETAGDGYLPPKRLSDPAEGNNWLASVVDVRKAYCDTVLSDEQVEWLELRYSQHCSVEQVAHRAGLGVEYVNGQLESALRRIQRTLGGERPTGCSSSCECKGKF